MEGIGKKLFNAFLVKVMNLTFLWWWIRKGRKVFNVASGVFRFSNDNKEKQILNECVDILIKFEYHSLLI